MNLREKRKNLKLVVLFRITVVLLLINFYLLFGSSDGNFEFEAEDEGYYRGRHLLATKKKNCTPPAINEFPSDGLTRSQRQHGWILIHTALACYSFILLAFVCDDFFVPAIKKICENMRMSEDIAGATFMAIASSCPELFINSVGTFVTEGDIGVGTIVGSAVFNVLAVPSCCYFFTNTVIQLEWWPITRDCSVYGVAVIMLISVLTDGIVEFNDAIMLIVTYLIYLILMFFNEQISNFFTRIYRKIKRPTTTIYQEILLESQPLLNGCHKSDFLTLSSSGEITLKDCEDLEESTNIWRWPKEETSLKKIWFVLTWPLSLILTATVPDCRKYPKLVPLTFVMSVIWIGATSYLIAWLITALGDSLSIPDSVMGLTFLAAGTSVPEAVSSVIVTNHGHGAMGLSSAIASNTFDILLCLGIPWMIKTLIYPKNDDENFIEINSSGLVFSAISLLFTLVFFYICLALNKFRLDWKIAVSCLLLYGSFLIVASLLEMNVFFVVNLPTCGR